MVSKSELMIVSLIAMMICCSISVFAYILTGSKDKPTNSNGPGGSGTVTFTVPTDATSLNECYASRYPDLRLAYGTDNTALGAHWTDAGTSEGRDHTCTLTDEQAQCYLERYPDAKTYAGTDLKMARKHYYETGIKENRDFACPPAKKEIECYLARYPDLQTAFGTNLYQANSHWHSTGKSDGRDYSCP